VKEAVDSYKKTLNKAQHKKQKSTLNGTFDDKCSQFDEACSVCLSHSFCGWCSVPVTYSDGQKGTQCAGFEGSTPFVCPGRYSTTNCEVGYQCESGTWQCVPTQPGNGMPKEVCIETCKQTPPPAPLRKQYTCNFTSQQCVRCTETHCPGSMPVHQCEAACAHPNPHPTPALIGVWRGVYIQNAYSNGEVDFVFTYDGVSVYKDGNLYFNASVIVLGADVLLFNITSGPNSGKTLGLLYQMSTQDFGMYTQMTVAVGMLDGAFPQDYNTPMFTPGEKELVLAKCLEAPCSFPSP